MLGTYTVSDCICTGVSRLEVPEQALDRLPQIRD